MLVYRIYQRPQDNEEAQWRPVTIDAYGRGPVLEFTNEEAARKEYSRLVAENEASVLEREVPPDGWVFVSIGPLPCLYRLVCIPVVVLEESDAVYPPPPGPDVGSAGGTHATAEPAQPNTAELDAEIATAAATA